MRRGSAVKQAAVVVRVGARAHQPHRRFGHGAAHQLLEAVRVQPVIGHERLAVDAVRVDQRHRTVVIGDQGQEGAVIDDADPGISGRITLGDLERVIAAAVVENGVAPVCVALRTDALDALAQELAPVVNRCNHADERAGGRGHVAVVHIMQRSLRGAGALPLLYERSAGGEGPPGPIRRSLRRCACCSLTPGRICHNCLAGSRRPPSTWCEQLAPVRAPGARSCARSGKYDRLWLRNRLSLPPHPPIFPGGPLSGYAGLPRLRSRPCTAGGARGFSPRRAGDRRRLA